MNFKKKIFGANVNKTIQDKLLARQHVSEFGESQQVITGSDGQSVDIHQVLDLSSNPNAKISELGSRTPWARAWVAVELYHIQNF